MCLRVLSQGKFRDVHIKEGQVFLLPGRIPHSPQRLENTVGLVIERLRRQHEMDCLRYYVEETDRSLFERWFYCEDLGSQLGPIIREYFASEQHKTGRPIPGTIPENPPYVPDGQRQLEEPFDLRGWVDLHRGEIQATGSKRIWGEGYETEVLVYGSDRRHELKTETVDMYLWIVEGAAVVQVDLRQFTVDGEHSILIRPGSRVTMDLSSNCLCLTVTMNPRSKPRSLSKSSA